MSHVTCDVRATEEEGVICCSENQTRNSSMKVTCAIILCMISTVLFARDASVTAAMKLNIQQPLSLFCRF
ncbi:hypothetical protein T11_14314 [Trichinella zimbabwensis]|uniref:Uncharacterized protein n=1 Tax=Trichinella zimbabwensis TaxID=268475 RepID=A0A0V1H4S2_9BILA|nr:hypothetical protein T11_14314 [Trichinella zimbabwensis]